MAYYIAPDAYGDTVLWSDQPDAETPRPVAFGRGCTDELWNLLTAGARVHNRNPRPWEQVTMDVRDEITEFPENTRPEPGETYRLGNRVYPTTVGGAFRDAIKGYRDA